MIYDVQIHIEDNRGNKTTRKTKKQSEYGKGGSVDREKTIRCITRFLNKATDAELRAICMAAYHITKRDP